MIGGGFYLRAFPGWLNRWFLRRFQRRHHGPPVIYLHPYDFDETCYNAWDMGVEHPMLNRRRRFMKWVLTYNRHRTLKRFDRLVRSSRWTAFREILA